MPSSSLTPEARPAPTDTPEPSPELASWLRAQTPARVALRRSGLSLATAEVLDFQLAHARARDAIHAPLQPASLLPALNALPHSPAGHLPILLHSQAESRQTYLQRPDLGRKLDQTSLERLQTSTKPEGNSFDLALILADGLSALAVDRHAVPLLAALLPALLAAGRRIAPICIVEQARVAIGDEIAHALHADLAIVLIGERPGLSSPDSLGAYITWNPQPGRTTDAARNCISNIRPEGLSYTEAAARLLHYIREARSRRITGIALKDPESTPQLPAGQTP